VVAAVLFFACSEALTGSAIHRPIDLAQC
jgi:hypothetical protein